MKNILIVLLFAAFSCYAQKPKSTQKGYYTTMVGDSVIGQNARPDKAFFDLYNYMRERKITKGIVTSPYWEVSIDYSDQVTAKTDTVIIYNGDISIGNQWMGEPVKEVKATGTVIYDTGGSHYTGGGPEVTFDGDLNTFRRANNQKGAWVGLDFGQQETIVKVRIYPHPQFNTSTMTLNGCLVQYSTNGTRWTKIGRASC